MAADISIPLVTGNTYGLATGAAVRIDGLNGLLRRLELMTAEMRDGLLEAGLTAGQPALERARLEVPVKSGRLQNTIRLSKTRRGVKIAAGSARTPYAARIHFGRRPDMGEQYGFRRVAYAGNPFLFRAIDRTRDRVAEIYMAEIVRLWGNA